jgi:hypothetical protein
VVNCVADAQNAAWSTRVRVSLCTIETKTLATDVVFWAVVTVPIVIFVTAKIANYALKRVKRKGRA